MTSQSLITKWTMRVLIAVLAIAVGVPADLAYAQQIQLPPPDSVLTQEHPEALPDAPSATPKVTAQNQTPQDQQPQQPEVVPVGPAGANEPAPATETQTQPATDQPAPEATPEPAPAPAQTTTAPAKNEQPLGTAAAEKGTTHGGAASKPAGVAIAPAKQKRSKSFFIKLGAVAAGAAALGAIYALSRSTSSTPPGAVR
jgi:hypothetical protein